MTTIKHHAISAVSFALALLAGACAVEDEDPETGRDEAQVAEDLYEEALESLAAVEDMEPATRAAIADAFAVEPDPVDRESNCQRYPPAACCVWDDCVTCTEQGSGCTAWTCDDGDQGAGCP